MSESVERDNGWAQNSPDFTRDGAVVQTLSYPKLNDQAAPPEDKTGDGQWEVVVKAAERPFVKVDLRKILVFHMVINTGSETFVVENFGPRSFSLRLEMVYHDYQSHFRIHARFARRPEDIDHISGEFHRIYVNLPRQAFGDVFDDFRLNKFEDLSQLPENAQNEPEVQRSIARDFLYTLDLDVKFMNLVRLNNQFAATSPGDEIKLQLLRKLDGTKPKIRLLLRVGEKDNLPLHNFNMHLSKESAPLGTYYHRSGSYAAYWGQRRDQEDTLSHKIETQTTYPTVAQWYITNMYGVLRNEEDALQSTESIQDSKRTISFFEAPGRPLPNGMHRHYLVFLEVDEMEASSSALDIGQIIHVCWVSPQDRKEVDPPPCKWKGQILPPLPGLEVYGNLLLLITRPNDETRVLEVNDVISSQMNIASDPLYLLLQDSHLSAKRLVNALNLAHDGQSEKHKILRRILLATDFSQIQFGNSLRQENAYKTQIDHIISLQAKFSISQRAVMNRILDSKNFIEFITGPFGTGKTSFIALLARCLKLLGKKVLLCCSSNSAVDTLASRIEEADPTLKAIRFHSMNTETRAIKLQGKFHRTALAKANEAQQGEQAANFQPNEEATAVQSNEQRTETKEDADLAELRQAFARLIPLSIFLAQEALGSRPNFSTMSLMARCLVHAGIEGDQETIQPDGDPHKDFRELFLRGDESREEYNEELINALEGLQQDVFSGTSVVLTTFSNSADKSLISYFEPDWIIGDEVGATCEAEFLIPVCGNLGSIERLLGVGDAQQLAPVVKTYNKKRLDESMINEFAESQVQPLILRLQRAGLQHNMFLECFRCTAGLEQPSSKLFYQNRVVNGLGTSLNERPKSRRTVDFLKSEFGIQTTIPRLVLDLRNGICLTGPSGSRYNLHNIAQTLQLIELLIGKGIFEPTDIAIQSPYREQNTRYRAAMAKAAMSPFWQDLNIWDVKLTTVDSFQGGEKPCVIFDMVTATNRKGGLGFLQQRQRLNVALTRSIDALFVIADVQATLEQKSVAKALAEGEELDPESQGQDIAELQQGQNVLKAVIEYYIKQSCTHFVDIKILKSNYVSFDEAEAFAVSIQKRCYRCQQLGHVSTNCTNPEAPRPKKSGGCRVCQEEGHLATDCPERVCHGCGEKGHFSSTCPNEKPIICGNCGEAGHVRRNCTHAQVARAKSCFICGLSDHQSSQCPNKPKSW